MTKIKTKTNRFYCLRCRKRVYCKLKDIDFTVYDNKKKGDGVHALVCNCPHCDAKVSKFISNCF
jgi:hypothetical protein